MGLFEKIRKNKAIRRYISEMPSLLKERYGASEFYTRGQIEATLSTGKFSNRYREYAYALFCNVKEVSGLISPEIYLNHRKELAEQYFSGNQSFTSKTVSACASSGFFFGAALDIFGGESGDSGGGDG